MVVDPGGKLWSTTVWCLVPVFQHDFGCCDALIGGGPALKKVRPDPAGESVVSFASRAEPGSEIRLEEYDMAKRKMSTFERLNTWPDEPYAAQRVGAAGGGERSRSDDRSPQRRRDRRGQ